MIKPDIRVVRHERDLVGECPLWDTDEGALYWVDSLRPALQRLDPVSGEVRSWRLPSPVGSFALAEPGTMLVALRDGFYGLDLITGDLTALARPEAHDPDVRFNDGRMDRDGRFVCGTMRVEIRDPPPGKLYRFSPDGRVDVLETGISISNATCFSPDGATLYFADSLTGVVWAYPYDRRSERVGPRRVFADVRPMSGSGADGAVTDSEGGVWVALTQVGCVARLKPNGALDVMFETPFAYPACPAFGGPDLDVLYVTSISDAGPRMRSDHPESGKLIAVHGLGASGIVEPRFTLAPLLRAAEAT